MRRASSRIHARSASGGSQVVPRPPYTKRRPAPRRIASSTGRSTAVPSGSTIPWMLHGTPSRNGITRTRSQRDPKKASAARASSSVSTRRTKSPPPLKPSRASPDHTTPCPSSSARVGLAQAGVVGERDDPRRRARPADRVPDLVGDQLVLQGGPPVRAAAEHRAPVDGGGADERTDQPDRLARRVVGVHRASYGVGQRVRDGVLAAQVLGHRRPVLDLQEDDVGLLRGGGRSRAEPGGDEQRPPGADLLEQRDQVDVARQRREAADDGPAAEQPAEVGAPHGALADVREVHGARLGGAAAAGRRFGPHVSQFSRPMVFTRVRPTGLAGGSARNPPGRSREQGAS